MKTMLFIFASFLLISCSQKSDDELLKEAKELIAKENYIQSLELLKNLSAKDENSKAVQEANFEIANLYYHKKIKEISDEATLKIAVEYFLKTAKSKYDKVISAKSLFCAGFILANEIKMYDSAKVIYNRFLVEFPEHELIVSVKSEIENLGLSADEILKKTLNARGSYSK